MIHPIIWIRRLRLKRRIRGAFWVWRGVDQLMDLSGMNRRDQRQAWEDFTNGRMVRRVILDRLAAAYGIKIKRERQTRIEMYAQQLLVSNQNLRAEVVRLKSAADISAQPPNPIPCKKETPNEVHPI